MNLLLLFIEIIVYFGVLLLLNKFFKKEGVYVWIAIASIMANIQVCKSIDILGISATLGNVLFASNFLATDILNELYGKKSAKKGVVIGGVAIIISIIMTQITLLFIPNEFDFVQESMKTLFDFNLRVSLSSLFMYILANYADVLLYAKLKNLKLWQKNNLCTILCNCLENFGFVFLAFGEQNLMIGNELKRFHWRETDLISKDDNEKRSIDCINEFIKMQRYINENKTNNRQLRLF